MEAFVYIWKNKINNRKYIGYHKGSQDDGYVSSTSNDSFWKDYENGELIREIILEGTRDECLKYEQNYLKSIDLSSDEWYNNARGAEIIFTQEVRDKIRNHHLGKPSGMLGKKHSEETKKKVQLAHKNIVHSEEWNKKVSQSLLGKKKSDEHRKNLSLAKKGLENKKNRDSTIYKFFNIKTKDLFTGTKMDFYKKYDIHPMLVYSLANGKTKSIRRTWILEI
jgi:hypothetical protein